MLFVYLVLFSEKIKVKELTGFEVCPFLIVRRVIMCCELSFIVIWVIIAIGYFPLRSHKSRLETIRKERQIVRGNNENQTSGMFLYPFGGMRYVFLLVTLVAHTSYVHRV